MIDQNRAYELLAAAHDLLNQCHESPFQLDVLSEVTTTYDGAERDGYSLMADIDGLLSETMGVHPLARKSA